jgi:hypothetical protein
MRLNLWTGGLFYTLLFKLFWNRTEPAPALARKPGKRGYERGESQPRAGKFSSCHRAARPWKINARLSLHSADRHTLAFKLAS